MRASDGKGMYGVEKKENKIPINRRKLAGAGVAILIVVSMLFFYYNGFPADSFHLEKRDSQSPPSSVWINLNELHDCVLNVSFLDDPALLYAFDIELSDTVFASEAFTFTVEDWGYPKITFQGAIIQTTAHPVYVDKVSLVLGSACPYFIGVSGENVTSTFHFGNNMTGSGTYVNYWAEGPYLAMTFTENMKFSNTGLEVHIEDISMVYIDIDLVDGVNGLVASDGPQFIHYNNGWVSDSDYWWNRWCTDPSNPEPLLSVGASDCDEMHLWLST